MTNLILFFPPFQIINNLKLVMKNTCCNVISGKRNARVCGVIVLINFVKVGIVYTITAAISIRYVASSITFTWQSMYANFIYLLFDQVIASWSFRLDFSEAFQLQIHGQGTAHFQCPCLLILHIFSVRAVWFFICYEYYLAIILANHEKTEKLMLSNVTKFIFCRLITQSSYKKFFCVRIICKLFVSHA